MSPFSPFPLIPVLLSLSLALTASASQCPPHQSPLSLATQMIESTLSRSQGTSSSSLLSTISLGIFQQALRESLAFPGHEISSSQKSRFLEALDASIGSLADGLEVAGTDAGLPLDRLSVGTSMIIASRENGKGEGYGDAIGALRRSVELQERNANGGFWYYADAGDLGAYRNLSYLDGMFSYPSFGLLAERKKDTGAEREGSFGIRAVARQIEILHGICRKGNGLLVHGYDAIKAHKWANKEKGASPVVWGRALGWYTLGLLNALEIVDDERWGNGRSKKGVREMERIFGEITGAQIAAAERSFNKTGKAGVWQVVDRPGESFGGKKNFVEASASCMTVYNLLRGVRMGFIEGDGLKQKARQVAGDIYGNILKEFLVKNSNGTIGLDGTSDIASLSGQDVNFEYYVTRPIVLNSLIGTSAFTLASFEMGRLCQG